jgi:preprotein translocase subunit SecE
MNPKEKAKELANKYFQDSDLLYLDLTWTQAKECATIAVDEIISVIENGKPIKSQYKYWQEVKEEINNI